MPSSLKCDLCGKPATVHLTQIVNGKMHKVDLCEACAQAKGVTDPGGFSLADLLLKASLNPESGGVEAATHGAACPSCGFTPSDFKKQGRFGCPRCYQTFAGMVAPMLENMHKGVRHAGKVPEKALRRRSLVERVAELETALAESIKTERYEDAARLRDELARARQEAAAPGDADTPAGLAPPTSRR
jgi:protein arginine kinase activator